MKKITCITTVHTRQEFPYHIMGAAAYTSEHLEMICCALKTMVNILNSYEMHLKKIQQ
jgi:hypothetical protein